MNRRGNGGANPGNFGETASAGHPCARLEPKAILAPEPQAFHRTGRPARPHHAMCPARRATHLHTTPCTYACRSHALARSTRPPPPRAPAGAYTIPHPTPPPASMPEFSAECPSPLEQQQTALLSARYQSLQNAHKPTRFGDFGTKSGHISSVLVSIFQAHGESSPQV